MQRHPLNPNAFIEPSSAELWQEAGLDLEELNVILDQYYQRQTLWGKGTFRKKIRAHELPPDISEEEAMRLLRISTLQAIHNARAYCVDFDEMNASQQMALSQLVFQMGVNLEEFVAFLSVINGIAGDSHTGQNASVVRNFNWKAVQGTLVATPNNIPLRLAHNNQCLSGVALSMFSNMRSPGELSPIRGRVPPLITVIRG